MVLIYFETPSLDFEKYDLTQLVEWHFRNP
jgi:hypothetical protein